MKIHSTYKARITSASPISKHFAPKRRLCRALQDTVDIYRRVVDFFIDVVLNEWEDISLIKGADNRMAFVETLTVSTKKRPDVKYPFGKGVFYKYPCYYRRSAINDAFGKVSSYKSNLSNWEKDPKGKKPKLNTCGYSYPALYKGNCYKKADDYTALIKVYINNTWDWAAVSLRKSDVDYMTKHCGEPLSPTLRRRGKVWSLDFAFEENVQLNSTDISDMNVLSVDLGINNAATINVMKADGTILGRHFLKLSKEEDSLYHALNRIKKAQQNGSHKTPRLWAKAKGINDDIASKTAAFIMYWATYYNVDVIVFEHLEVRKKKRGSKKQRLHHWRAQEVQRIVTHRAHSLKMHVSHICAWGTSKYAYDGSGKVERCVDGNYSICRFKSGKIYNCDLSASYNIASRYFIREILKSLPAKVRSQLEAKVPQASKRSTCTYSTLISLNAELKNLGSFATGESCQQTAA